MTGRHAKGESDRERWADLEINPFKSDEAAPDDEQAQARAKGTPESLESFPSESPADAPKLTLAETQPAEEALPASAENEDGIDDRPEIAAFQTAVREARDEAQAELRALVERIRKDDSQQHADEIRQLTDQHALELEETRSRVEAETSARVRQEERDRYAGQLTRVREELARRYVEDLKSARIAAVESIKALTGNVVSGLERPQL